MKMNMIKSLDLSITLQKIQSMEKHIKEHYGNTNSKIEIWKTFKDLTNYKEKRRKGKYELKEI